MNLQPVALLLIVMGLLEIGAGLWAYLGPLEPYGAPRGFKNMGKTWHGRGSVCAALPAGVFFLFLGLGATVDDDTLRRLLLYVAGISLLLALFFLLRAPAQVRPQWLLEPEPKPEPKPEPSEDGPQV